MAVFPDGRFALRIGLRHGQDVLRVWEVRELAVAGSEGPSVTGWRHVGYLSDEEMVASVATPAEPLMDVAALADELEDRAQFAAARLLRERITQARHAWVGV